MQPDVAVQPAEIRVEMHSHSTRSRAGGLLLVFVLLSTFTASTLSWPPNFTNSVMSKPARRDAVLIHADGLAVEEEMARLLHAVEFEEDLPAVGAGGQLEMLAIPADARPAVWSPPPWLMKAR